MARSRDGEHGLMLFKIKATLGNDVEIVVQAIVIMYDIRENYI